MTPLSAHIGLNSGVVWHALMQLVMAGESVVDPTTGAAVVVVGLVGLVGRVGLFQLGNCGPEPTSPSPQSHLCLFTRKLPAFVETNNAVKAGSKKQRFNLKIPPFVIENSDLKLKKKTKE